MNAQTTDVLYVPSQKTILVTYNNYSPIGFYFGGYIVSSISDTYIYTTPLSVLNRAGINLNYENKLSLMVGVFTTKNESSLNLNHDIWVKINPLRTIFKVKKGPDFSFAINYSDKIRYGLGLSLNFW